MIDYAKFDQRPIVVAVAAPNGAGTSTFCAAHLGDSGLPVVNADILASELRLDPYVAAAVADAVRRALVTRGASFVFETVFSDPVGAKLEFLREASEAGYAVVLCYIGIAGPEVSQERVAMRVSQGGHDVPDEKLQERFPRTLDNLGKALREVPSVLVFDNDDLATPFRLVAEFEEGCLLTSNEPIPRWLRALL